MARVTGIVFEVKDAATGQMKKIEAEFVSATTKMGNEGAKSSKKIADGNKDLVSSLTKVYFQVQILEGLFIKFFQVPISGFKTVTEEALKFEKSIAQISTIVDSAQIPTKQLNKEVSETAIAFGQDKVKTASAYYEILSSGAVSASEANQLLSVASKMAVAGGTEVDTAMGGLTTTMAAYGLSADKAKDVSDAFFAAAAAGKTNIKELSHFIGESAAVASQAGVGYDELLAAIAAGSTTLGSTRFAVTGLNQAIQHILAPTESAKKEAARLGIEFSAAGIQAKGLRQYLIDLVNAPNMTAASMKKLFESIEAVKLVSAITANEGQKFAETLEVVENRAGKTTEAFDKMAKTSEFLFQKMNTSFSITQSKLGSLITETEAYKGSLKGLEEISGAIQVLVEKYMPEDTTAFGIEKVANAVLTLTISINNLGISLIDLFLPFTKVIDSFIAVINLGSKVTDLLPEGTIKTWLLGIGNLADIVVRVAASTSNNQGTLTQSLLSSQRVARELNIELRDIIANRQNMSLVPTEDKLFSDEFVGPPAPKDKEKDFGSSESTKKGKKEKSWETIFGEAELLHLKNALAEEAKMLKDRNDILDDLENRNKALRAKRARLIENEKEFQLKVELERIKEIQAIDKKHAKFMEKMYEEDKRMYEEHSRDMENISRTLGSFFVEGGKSLIEGTKTLGDMFEDLLQMILAKVAEFLVSSAIQTFLMFITGGVGGGFLGVLGSIFGGGIMSPAYSNGGPVKGFASGGFVSGGMPNVDSVPALLTPGEFVLSKDVVNQIKQGRSSLTSNSNTTTTRQNQVINNFNMNAFIPPTSTDFDKYVGDNLNPSLNRISKRGIVRRR